MKEWTRSGRVDTKWKSGHGVEEWTRNGIVDTEWNDHLPILSLRLGSTNLGSCRG